MAASHRAVLSELDITTPRDTRRRQNNRAENVRQPFRRRAYSVRLFQRPVMLQKLIFIHNPFNLDRHPIRQKVF